LIAVLFGENYVGAGAVLTVHVWAALFVFLNVASGRWIYAENLAYLAFRRALLGAVINVVMNWLLIPHYGILGAAYATLISFTVSAFFSDMFSRKTRVVFYQKAKALALVNIARQVSRTFKSI
jgi:PST family polysaccharide transporter